MESRRRRRPEIQLSVIIPTLNAAATLDAAITPLVANPRLVDEVIVVDGGSLDDTSRLAIRNGARLVLAERGRGQQLGAGAAVASGDWLLFLHADTVLSEGWTGAVEDHISSPDAAHTAAVFRFALASASAAARRLEATVAWRTRTLGLPYGDQGLLISRTLYDEVGGFRPLVLMEDVDIVRRIGRRRISQLGATAVTSAERYRRSGYRRRSLRNLFCLALFYMTVPPDVIARIYR